MKKLLLFLSLLFLSVNGYAQSNPDEEILVFFNSGVSQVEKTINGKKVKTAKITKDKLLKSLSEIGITNALMEVAMPKFNQADTLKVLENGQKIQQLDMTKLFKIKVPAGKKRQELIEFLNSLPEVLYAEPNGKIVPLVVPSDTRFTEQWGLKNSTTSGADIHAEAAWEVYTGNPNNIIAVIDGGVQTNHVDLDNKISGGDTGVGWEGHGTHVAGISAAESDNSQGVSGVDWKAKIHSQRIDNATDHADTYQAIVDAVNFSPNVQVLNHSWGLLDENENPGQYSITVRQAFSYAYKANRTSVVAMGNHQQTDPGVVAYPAGFGNVIAVGATNINDVIAGFSAQGNHIDVSAPGVGILSTINGDYAPNSGTSMATPFVSGIASLLKGYNASLANDDIENIIRLSADDRGDIGFDNEYGFGRVNAEDALKFLEAPYSLSQLTATSGSAVSSTGQSQVVFMSAGSLASGTYIAKRYEVRKEVVFPDEYLSIDGVWGRGVFTTGWNVSNPNFGEGFCEVVPGTLTNSGATLRTYVYEVWSVTGSYLGYYPKSPSNVDFAYTVLGVKAPILNGPATLCGNTTYTFDDIPHGTSVSWSSSSNIEIVSSSNSEITVKPSSTSIRGEGQITYTINSSYGTSVSSKEMYVGKPYAYLPQAPTICTNTFMTDPYTLPASEGAESYRLVSSSSNLTIDGLSEVTYYDAPVQIHFIASQAGTYLVELFTTNSCGTSRGAMYVTAESCGGTGFETYAVYPNPASEEVLIEDVAKRENNASAQGAAYSQQARLGKLYDFSGNLVKTVPLQARAAITRMEVSNLKAGLYFLKIQVGEDEEVYKIIVAH